jgi:Ca2+-binding RTX toxin-like protein
VLACAALLTAAPASAGTVCADGTTAVFQASDVVGPPCAGAAAAGEVNHLAVGVDATGAVTFSDTVAIADGGGCTVDGNSAVCPGTTSVRFDLGNGDDSATVGSVASAGPSTGGAGADSLTGGPLGDALSGGGDNDTIDGGGGDDSLLGEGGNDVLRGGAGLDTLTGGDDADALAGGDGADSLDGGAGNDQLDGGGGDDTAAGGTGNDTVGGGTGDDRLSGGDGNDSVGGGDGSDRLEGDPATGSCAGSRGSDSVTGDGGDDSLCAGDGPSTGPDADSLGGGDGIDHVFYPRAAALAVSLEDAANDGEPGEGDNVKSDVEAVTGGDGPDTLTGNDAGNALDGAGGADVVSGAGGPDYLADSGGDSAADQLNGGPGDDYLADAGGGPDSYSGGDGDDLLIAYALRRSAVGVTLDGRADDGGAGEADNVAPDVEGVLGGFGDDTIVGNDADNELSGGEGADSIAGRGGNDGLHGGGGRDALDGGAGRDLLDGGGGADSLTSRDGETDRDACGGGTDRVQADGRDDVDGDCETKDFAPPAPVAIQSVIVTRAGYVVVRITCPAVEARCGGVVIVKTTRRIARRFIKLGQKNYQRLRGGDSKVVRAKISGRDRRPLRRARRVKVRAVVTNVNTETTLSTSATKIARVTTRGL